MPKFSLKPLLVGMIALVMGLPFSVSVYANEGNKKSVELMNILEHEKIHQKGREEVKARLTFGQAIQKIAMEKGKKGAKFAGHQLHTLALLIILGGTERVGEHMSTYLKTGKADSLDEVFKELFEIASSTAFSAELWSQMMGSQTVHGMQKAIMWGGKLFKGESAIKKQLIMGQPIVTQQMSRAMFLFRQTLGYIGFFGWEFGRELYKAALEDFSRTVLNDNSKVNDIDVIRAQSIFELIKDPELLTEFMASVFYVLGKEETLRRMFNTSVRRWTTWDLLGMFGALGMGGYVGRSLGRKAIARAAGYFFGRKAAARVGSQVGRSRAGKVGVVIGGFIGVAVFALVKDIDLLSGQHGLLTELDRWTVLTPRKYYIERGEENALAGLKYPDFGASAFERLKDIVGYQKIKKNLSLAKDRLNQHKTYRQTVMGDYLALIAPHMIHILKFFVARGDILGQQAQFYKDYVFSSRKDGSRKFLLNQAYKKYKPIAEEIMAKQRELDWSYEMLKDADWEWRRDRLIDSLKTKKEKEDFKKNLTRARYRAAIKYKIRMLKQSNPILTESVSLSGHELFTEHKLEVKKKLWEWLYDRPPYIGFQKKALHKALHRKGMRVLRGERQVKHLLEKLFPSQSYAMSNADRMKERWKDGGIMGANLTSAMRGFNLRENRFYYYHQKLVDHADQMIEERYWHSFEDQTKVKKLLKDHQKRMKEISAAFEDLFNWQEMNYLFIFEKINFILKWAADGVDEDHFLEKYRAHRKSLDDQLLLVKRQQVASLHTYLIMIEFSTLKLLEVGRTSYRALMNIPQERAKIQKEARDYLINSADDMNRVNFLFKCHTYLKKFDPYLKTARHRETAKTGIKFFLTSRLLSKIIKMGNKRYSAMEDYPSMKKTFYNDLFSYYKLNIKDYLNSLFRMRSLSLIK